MKTQGCTPHRHGWRSGWFGVGYKGWPWAKIGGFQKIDKTMFAQLENILNWRPRFPCGHINVFFFLLLIAPAGTRRLVPGIVSDCSKFCFCVNLGTLKNYKLWVGEGNIKAQCTRPWKSIFESRRGVNNVQVTPLRGRETQQCLCFSAVVAAADVAARANSVTTCWRMLGEGRASGGRGPYWLLLAWDHWPFSVFCIWSPERDGAKLTASNDIQAAPARRWLGSRWTFRVQGGPRLLASPTAGGRDDQISLSGR